ncbi:Uncharacterised protein [Serratia ficaria]|uniref:hypothetical protein n=1 Tax=Serratia ficaria TaxID=61651 RepID=UPI0021838927|nr:hypothetical protein [Serratia ficaria]CAI2488654.1 Uncharacterised protein [Serratia ficaria]CAI2533543.1 Uncharacterised protein [Serratia ficaria]
MSNKQEAINAVNRAIGFIRANADYDLCNKFATELNSALDFMENVGQHEEYKAAWLSLVNAIHSIDPEWLEKYRGESELQKACAFIADQNQVLKNATDTLESLKHRYIGIDFAACVSDNIHRQILEDGLFRAGHRTHQLFASHTHYQPVYFHDLLRSTAITQIKEELAAAEKKCPTWPTNTINASDILYAAAADLSRAAIGFHYKGGSLEKVRREAAQVGAMAIRVLINLPYAKRHDDVAKVTGATR